MLRISVKKQKKGEKSMKKKIIYFMILVLLCMSAGCGTEKKEGILLPGSMDTEEEISEEQDSKKEAAKEADNSESEQLIYVQVNGAVAKPGVYALAEGSRIFQAVELAGGVTESADIRSLNQAEVLSDGQMIYIMNQEEAAAQNIPTEVQQEDGRVNLNTATEEELMTLPGIGAAKAKNILAWREENGSFTQIEDLMKIEGIKDGVFSKIKDSVKVN